jgi:hypothetical protein
MEKERGENWKKELARDFLAFGSWVFFVLVIARAAIKPYRPFVDQMIIAGFLLLIIGFVLKKFDIDYYISRGLVLVIFTSIFYEDNLFSFFAILVMIGLVFSSYFVRNSLKRVGLGLVVGGIVSWLSWWFAGFGFG